MCLNMCAEHLCIISQDTLPDLGSGAIHAAKLWWGTIPRSTWVQNWIECGVPLHWDDLKQRAPPCNIPNHPGALKHADFVTKSMQDLLQAGAVEIWDHAPKCVHPMHVVPKKNGKLRLIVDLRHVNKYLYKPKFKYEKLSQLEFLCSKGEWMCSLDLTNGYWQLNMRPDTYEYLGVHWQGHYYVFKVLPFGLSTAPWVFQECMTTFCAHLRSHGIKCLNYLDDFALMLGTDIHEAKSTMQWICEQFKLAGLHINVEKSMMDPSHVMQCLGFEVDSMQGFYSLPKTRWQALHDQMQKINMHNGAVKAREIARVCGYLASCKLVLGETVRFHTRELYECINEPARTRSWNAKVHVSAQAKQELSRWLTLPVEAFRATMWPGPDAEGLAVFCDASASGWGATLGSLEALGAFSGEVAATGSGCRELHAILAAVKTFGPHLRGRRIHIFTDSTNARDIMQRGSKRMHLHRVATAVVDALDQLGVHWRITWVPRALNQKADDLSKCEDMSDWHLNPTVFQQIEQAWGRHDIDRFAATHNRHCEHFNALYPCPDCEAVDAFTQHWGNCVNFVNPPFCILGRVLQKIQAERATCTVIVPDWRSAPWWPVLVSSPGVVDVLELPPAPSLFVPGRIGARWGVGVPRWRSFAVRFAWPRRYLRGA